MRFEAGRKGVLLDIGDSAVEWLIRAVYSL